MRNGFFCADALGFGPESSLCDHNYHFGSVKQGNWFVDRIEIVQIDRSKKKFDIA